MKTVNKLLAVIILTMLAWALFTKAQAQDSGIDRTSYIMNISHTKYIAHKTGDSSWVITDPDAMIELNDYHIILIDSVWRSTYRQLEAKFNALIRYVRAHGTKDELRLGKEYLKLQNQK